LEIKEKTGCSYSSTHSGLMHACGHDGHTAMLLGFAKYLTKNPPKDNVVLVFQPAEEGGKGAAQMIESGLCDADEFYALHMDPFLETGKIGCAPDEAMAGRDRFEITVSGSSRHASLRDGKRDAVLACARLVCETRYLNGADFIFQANIIQGGTAANIIADTAILTGTVRYFSNKVLQQKYKKLDAIIKAIQATDEVKIKIKIGDKRYPPLINTRQAVEKIKKLDGFVPASKKFAAEDFSLFINKYSGALIWLGAKVAGFPLHSNKFNFDENALINGVQVFKHLLQQ
jgi:hippurate hydrolase